MSRTQAEIDFEWLRINSGRLKIGFGLRPAAEKCRLPSGKNTFLNERLAGVRVAIPQMGQCTHALAWCFDCTGCKRPERARMRAFAARRRARAAARAAALW